MNTCETCKWWDGRGFHHSNWGTQRRCISEKADSVDDDAMFAESDDVAYVITGPRFGCIHHELK
jgi:hypothetical protein